MTIAIQETLRAVFYAPFYSALALGAFEKEGVEVVLKTSPRPSDAARGILDGSIDVTWGGPLRVIKTREEVPGCDIVCFCEVVTRDPFVLVGRAPCPGFKMADLAGATLATVSEVPTPWVCLQNDIRKSGMDPASIRRIADQSMAENVESLRGGQVDVIQVFEPFVAEAIAAGVGHVWYAAADRGPTSYTTFYARRDVVDARRQEFVRLVRAIYRTQKWIHRAPPAEIAQVVADYFPHVPATWLTAAMDRYQSLGVWGKNPYLPRSGYERLREAILAAGFARAAASYDDAVYNAMASEVVGEDDEPPVVNA